MGDPRLPLRAMFPPAPPLGVRGDPGVIRPYGVAQRLAGDRLVLAGGPAAVLLQVAHPLVGAGVALHSDYAARPGHRLVATLQLTLAIGFGDTAQARAAASSVGRRHATVNGEISDAAGAFAAGTRYDATDPELTLWVYGTLAFCAVAVHQRYGRGVTPAECEQSWQETKPFLHLFGVPDELIPATWQDFLAWWDLQVPRLAVTPVVARVAQDMLVPRLFPPLPGLGIVLRAVTSDLLPEPVRAAYGVPLTRGRRLLVAVLAAVTRVVWPRLPRRLREFPHVRQVEQRLG
ncbi:uncharacterized protein (DUF2236 family) [Motilibacter rhizosphaerae]|uniref:Uncharacterized protein (DUF2236 family) n=1 Tax=Motilibacter rhizosphaerae TaxID=598652 RepID=A0A4V2F2T3_9ACTN|nr:oxygenase MpaB family protein [Motilibacter rhizosphaerae]RZS79994.1 uncharacterized protein (DUF2236 family) [Motilibacter rhizosphaerae]